MEPPLVIRSAVTVSLVPEASRGPFIFHGDLPGACREAKALGFDAIELFPPGPSAVDPAELRTLLDDHGLSLAAVGTGAGWAKHKLHLTLPDEARRREARAFIASIIDFAGSLGAPAIIGSMQGRSGDGVDHNAALSYLREAVEELSERASRHGVPLLIEPLNRYETDMLNTVADGLDFIGSLKSENVRLLADVFHMNIEEIEIAASIRWGAEAIGHLHFVDSNRRSAGSGHVDFGPIAMALKAIGYIGYASAEALPYPDSSSAAKATIEAFRRHFRRA
jgi:sugar phosphate isomerase/epimerase